MASILFSCIYKVKKQNQGLEAYLRFLLLRNSGSMNRRNSAPPPPPRLSREWERFIHNVTCLNFSQTQTRSLLLTSKHISAVSIFPFLAAFNWVTDTALMIVKFTIIGCYCVNMFTDNQFCRGTPWVIVFVNRTVNVICVFWRTRSTFTTFESQAHLSLQ